MLSDFPKNPAPLVVAAFLALGWAEPGLQHNQHPLWHQIIVQCPSFNVQQSKPEHRLFMRNRLQRKWPSGPKRGM